MNNLITLYFIFLIVIGISSGCSSGNDKDSMWFEYSEHNDRDFTTNNIELAQREVPFDIVVPSYIPSELEGSLTIYGEEVTDVWTEEIQPDLRIIILYTRDDSSRFECSVEIEEHVCNPSSGQELGVSWVGAGWGDSSEEIEIAGITVKYAVGTISAYSDKDGFSESPGECYVWYQSNTCIRVDVAGYDHAEVIRIVESMINNAS